MSFHGQGNRLGGPATTSAAPAAASGYATSDLRSIPMAEVVSGPPGAAGSSSAPQASVPNAQMAYTVRAPQAQQMQEPVVVMDPALARYIASQEQGAIPPAPPDYLALSACSCFCCWPLALVAIYQSRLVRFFYERGQFIHAYEASRRAKQMATFSIVLGTTSMVLYYFMLQRRRQRED